MGALKDRGVSRALPPSSTQRLSAGMWSRGADAREPLPSPKGTGRGRFSANGFRASSLIAHLLRRRARSAHPHPS